MNHEEAIDSHAAERYLLGELSGDQRDAFEEHYFGCDVCAADMQDGATLVAGVRAAGREANPFLARRDVRRRNLAPAFAVAASLLVALLAYQQFGVIKPLRDDLESERAPRIAAVYTLRDVRADGQVVIDAAGSPFTLDFDIPADPPSPSYTCTIKDAVGKARLSVPVSAAQARDPIPLTLHASTLGNGNYTLEVTGANGAPVVTYDFTLR
jgi:hypothetical protein